MAVGVPYQNIFFDPDNNPIWTSPGISLVYENILNVNDLNIFFVCDGSFKAHVEARTVFKQNEVMCSEWLPMSTVSMNKLKVIDTIVENGIYSTSISGIAQVRIVVEELEGTLKITGGLGD